MRETARIYGATKGNRTLILALARPRTNHCTTAAYGALTPIRTKINGCIQDNCCTIEPWGHLLIWSRTTDSNRDHLLGGQRRYHYASTTLVPPSIHLKGFKTFISDFYLHLGHGGELMVSTHIRRWSAGTTLLAEIFSGVPRLSLVL